MSLPKSKILTASKAIMMIATKDKAERNNHNKNQQHQTVNITLQPRSQVSYKSPVKTAYPNIVERDIKLDLDVAAPAPNYESVTPQPVQGTSTSTFIQEDTATAQTYEELEQLHSMLNNYETVAKALILIIELIESNPLIVNKIIVPTETTFIDLIALLTGADEVDIKYLEEVGCTLSSKKYNLVEEVFVIKDGESQSLKYNYPDVIRLLDRFKISFKMIVRTRPITYH